MTPILVQVTVGGDEEARTIAAALVEARLACCVNWAPAVTSLYRWKGKIEESSERVLSIKTSLELWPKVASRVRTLHSYECPEIIAVPLVTGDPDYLRWWADNLETVSSAP